jgi:hypothetical protein
MHAEWMLLMVLVSHLFGKKVCFIVQHRPISRTDAPSSQHKYRTVESERQKRLDYASTVEAVREGLGRDLERQHSKREMW